MGLKRRKLILKPVVEVLGQSKSNNFAIFSVGAGGIVMMIRIDERGYIAHAMQISSEYSLHDGSFYVV